MTLSDVRALGDLHVLALTIWGEARSEPIEGRVAVGCVIRNRFTSHPARFGRSYVDVCLAPKQFSCWNEGHDANHRALMMLAQAIEDGAGSLTDQTWRECCWVATGIISDELRDRTDDATHYVTKALYNGAAPKWVRLAPVVSEVGAHVFMTA